MHVLQKRRGALENGDSLSSLASLLANREDLGPVVRHAFASGKPEALLNNLSNIVKQKDVEIEELCKLHYEEFILAVDELRGALADLDRLKGVISSENLRLQEAGNDLLLKIDELLELYSVKKNVAAAIRTLNTCTKVCTLCVTCNKCISDGRVLPALKILNLVEKEYLQNITLKLLRRAIERPIPAIKDQVKRKSIVEFNKWLVYIRKIAREIGQLSIAHSSSTRQRDDELRSQQREAEEQSRSGLGDHVYALNLVDMGEEASVEFDLTPVYRAYHIHECLGIGGAFQDYYFDSRMKQLNSDLQISAEEKSFLESHKPFFAQIAGFFIVEDQVLRSADGLLSDQQIESFWEIAITKITSILQERFAELDSANHLLVIKDYVALFGATLKRYGYDISSLLTVLDDSQHKYHELLFKECHKKITDILSTDSFEPMVIKKEYDYKINVLNFDLQPPDILPDFPYTAPFSPSVPEICRVVRSFIEDSINYLSYGSILKYYGIARNYLDSLLNEVLNENLVNVIRHGSLVTRQMMQIEANVVALEHACDVFIWQVAQRCGIPRQLVEKSDSGLTAKTMLKASQITACDALIDRANAELDKIMEQMSTINWIGEEPPEHINDYMNEVKLHLHNLVMMAQQILPTEIFYKVFHAVITHVADSMMATFLSDAVKRFNVNAVIGIDKDLKELESFADERFHQFGFGASWDEASFRDGLAEVRQLVNLLLSNQPEGFVNPVTREKYYGSLDYKKVTVICEKFKDSPDRLFGSLSNRNSKRRNSMDVLKRRLKDFS